jgi:hypothetical protein
MAKLTQAGVIFPDGSELTTATGAIGADGAQGVPGVKGDKGDIGNTGADGADGADGNLTGPAGPTGAKGDKGDTGNTGAAGADGALNALPLTGGTVTGNITATAYYGDGSNLEGVSSSSNTTPQGLYEHSATIDSNYTIGVGNNAMSAGPITIANGVTVTVPGTSNWIIV